MAQPTLDRFKKRGVAGKVETTEGVDIVPTALADGILLMNGTSGTEFDVVERPIDRAFFTNDPFSVANKRAFVSGDFELFAPEIPGTEPAACDVILRTAGFKRTYTVGSNLITGKTRYTPSSLNAEMVSGTFYWWHVDKHKRILGARTAISRMAMTIGGRFSGTCRILGSYTEVLDEAIPAITTYEDVPSVIRYNNTITTVSVYDAAGVPGTPIEVWGKEISIDTGTTLQSKEYTQLKVNAISDRRGTWSMRIARQTKADLDLWLIRDSSTIIAGVMRHDEGTGLYSEIGFRGQIEQVNEVEIDGDYGIELTGRCIASSAGSDEMWVEFGDTTAAGS